MPFTEGDIPTTFAEMRKQVTEIAQFIRDASTQEPPTDAAQIESRMLAKAIWVVGMTGIQIAQELNEIKHALREIRNKP